MPFSPDERLTLFDGRDGDFDFQGSAAERVRRKVRLERLSVFHDRRKIRSVLPDDRLAELRSVRFPSNLTRGDTLNGNRNVTIDPGAFETQKNLIFICGNSHRAAINICTHVKLRYVLAATDIDGHAGADSYFGFSREVPSMSCDQKGVRQAFEFLVAFEFREHHLYFE